MDSSKISENTSTIVNNCLNSYAISFLMRLYIVKERTAVLFGFSTGGVVTGYNEINGKITDEFDEQCYGQDRGPLLGVEVDLKTVFGLRALYYYGKSDIFAGPIKDDAFHRSWTFGFYYRIRLKEQK